MPCIVESNCLTRDASPAGETPQVPADPASGASDNASAPADQPTADFSGGDVAEDADPQSPPADGSGFEVVEQSAALQEPAQRPDVPQQTQVLHVCLGSLPDMHMSCKAFYFLRSQPGRLTIEDIDTQLECGVLSEGPSLKMLQQVKFVTSMQDKAALSQQL